MSVVRRVTPVLIVDAIEPVLPFWARLGVAKTVEVPDGDRREPGGHVVIFARPAP